MVRKIDHTLLSNTNKMLLKDFPFVKEKCRNKAFCRYKVLFHCFTFLRKNFFLPARLFFHRIFPPCTLIRYARLLGNAEYAILI